MYQYNLLSRSITHLPGLKQLQMLDKQHDKGILIMNFVGQKPYCKVQGHALHNILTPGGYSHRNAIRGCAAQMGRFLTKKSLNMGPIFGPKIPKHVSIF